MSPGWRFSLCLAALALTVVASAQSNSPAAFTLPVPVKMSAPSGVAGVPADRSPVAFFRTLLQSSPAERNKLLASRPALSRGRILAKVREYETLDPEEREERLQATELRWYLMPLIHAARADREKLLAQVPADLLPLVKSRLVRWDMLLPPQQQEFLANDHTLRYFAQTPRSGATNSQSEKIANQFSHWFFDFTPEEKERLLVTLSEPERAQMEKTLKTFDGLPAQQRLLCVRNYAKFAGMTEAERAEFLKNADSWSRMSAEERRTWRDLVANVPTWPPMPPIRPPLPPPLLPNAAKDRVATN